VEGLQAGLVDKIDRNIAEIIVQKKYEDIVQYLQDALEASSEDEDNFKNVALELEEKIKRLASSKSDRMEIQPLQESLVKAEASIAKLMNQQREVGKSDEVYSKTEVNLLLDLKVDKENFEDLVNQVIKSRRGKRMVPGAGGGGGLGSLLEEMNKTAHNADGSPAGDADGQEGARGDDPLQGTSKENRLSTLQHRDSRRSLGGFPSSTPGVYRAPTEGGRPGGYSEKANLAATTGGSRSGASGGVYNNSTYKGVPTGLFPPANGAIALSRSANDLHVSNADRDGGYSPTRLMSPERQGSKDEYAYLGAATKGGGFNTRQQSTGKPPVINALTVASKNHPPSPDKEG
jgi:hypothetical protein